MAESSGRALAAQSHGHAQDELLLLEKVLLRVASADSDAALSTELAKFLTPVLLKLTSGHEGVRKKVMEASVQYECVRSGCG
jgi:proteasome component ECM29